MSIHAKNVLTQQGWAENVRVELENVRISRVEIGAKARNGDVTVDTLLPALSNLHSHAFQRAMAGMTEFRGSTRDSFWTWRDLMYRFLDHLTPDQIEAIAGLVYMEMLEAGYAAVGEFHYVHHQPGGTRYETLCELSQRVFAAASETGIGLTHLPVLYSYAGVDRSPLVGGQLRFFNDPQRFSKLVQDCDAALRNLPPDARLGIAPHSLRATDQEGLDTVLAAHPFGPVHMHIAEQTPEVKDILETYGQRPVDWLLSHVQVDERWCLIHATHMTPAETQALARSGAIAGLCPITEANLGDGIFDGATFLTSGGRFGIGSDSNIRIALGEELRQLEYSQRLRDQARNILTSNDKSTGHTLYTQAARGGAQALDRDAGRIEIGALADLVAIDSAAPALCALNPDQLLDGVCFAAGPEVVTDTWSAGRHMVQSGRHVHRDRIVGRYRKAMQSLADKL